MLPHIKNILDEIKFDKKLETLDELYDLVNLIRLFLQFISNRRVIDIDEIFIMKEKLQIIYI